jgi:hypothetical protein
MKTTINAAQLPMSFRVESITNTICTIALILSADDLSRWQQIIIAILMVIATPIFLVIAVGVLLFCVAGAAVAGALVGPCVVGSSTYTSECCGPWFIILMVTLPIIMVVCSVGAAIKIFYEGMLIFVNVVESYFSTIQHLFCPPEEDQLELGI